MTILTSIFDYVMDYCDDHLMCNDCCRFAADGVQCEFCQRREEEYRDEWLAFDGAVDIAQHEQHFARTGDCL